MVFASSSSVYGNAPELPLRESMAPDPISPYGVAKLAAERYCVSFSRVYDFETGNEIWRAEDWTTSWMLAAKSDYRRIVATSQDGRVLVIDFGLRKELDNDGTPIEGVDLLREIPLENTNAIIFRNPFEESY